MSILMMTAMLLGQTPMADLCAIRDGLVPLGSSVEVQGRYYSDFVRSGGLRNSDGSCEVSWAWSDDAGESEAERKFNDATWRHPAPRPDTTQTVFFVHVRGEVMQNDRGESVILVTKLQSFSIDGAAQ